MDIRPHVYSPDSERHERLSPVYSLRPSLLWLVDRSTGEDVPVHHRL